MEGRFVESTIRSDEHVCVWSRSSICWAVDSCHGLFGVWVAGSGAVVAVWVFVVVLDAVLRVVGADGVGVGSHDVATSMDCVNGVWGLSWGGRGGVGGGVGHRGWWGCLGGFVEYTTRSEERVRTTSHTGVFWAINGAGALFTAR
jgi:hypothetical protein